MDIINCEHCNKEIDLNNKESYDYNATMRMVSPTCADCEDKFWEMAEEQEQKFNEIYRKMKSIIN